MKATPTKATPSGQSIRAATFQDAPAIGVIYNYYVAQTIVTFEEQTVPDAAIAERIQQVIAAGLPWLVAELAGGLGGFAYARPWHARSAYRFSVESTIYLASTVTRRGIGTLLYRALLDELRARGLHCAIGGIALPNPASVALHEKLGFRPAGTLREVGWKLGRWVDVGFWELLL